MKQRRLVTGIAAATLMLSLAACAPSDDGGGDSASIEWWTWDPNQAAAYEQCIDDFEAANPGITVKITQYNSADYFTKLTAGFVGGTAPDAFMNSVQYLPTYADQGQLEPLDDYIAADGYDLDAFTVGTDVWQSRDGKQYGIPMDWATSGVYYNRDLIEAAGFTDDDIQNMTFNPTDGGTIQQIIAHLTVDANGVRGDESGFDKDNVETYGIGTIAGSDFHGTLSFGPFVGAMGWTLEGGGSWPTEFDFADPRVVATMDWITRMSDAGYAPRLGEFTSAASQQLGSGEVAIAIGGSWEAATYNQLPGLRVGIARGPVGPEGDRRARGNANGNVIWAGSTNKDATWKWISYQESEACQTTASTFNTSFLPSNGDSMQTLLEDQQAKGLDLSVFMTVAESGELDLSTPIDNGTAVQAALNPLLESYFTGESGDEVWERMTEASRRAIAEGK